MIAGASGLLPLARPVTSSSFSRGEVIVIGAGIAGLGAARWLNRAGFSVTVLEARDRIGGRIWSDQSMGIPVDMGASWIEGDQRNPIAALAREFGVKTVVDDDEWKFFEPTGRPIDPATVREVESALEWLSKAMERVSARLDADISIEQAVKRALIDEHLDADEVRYLNLALASLESSSGVDVAQQSLNHPASDSRFEGESLLFPEGYGQIARGLASRLNIQLGVPVEEVDYEGARVRVTTSRGVHEADRVVVSVPLGVLKSGGIRFSPELPPDKLQAINRLEMGLLNKIVLKFPSVFWPRDVTKFGYVGRTKGEFPATLNWYKISGKPVLMSFVAAGFARQLEILSDSEIVTRQMVVLRKIFGPQAPDPTEKVISRWASDPYAGGCYSYSPVGATDRDYDRLAERVGPISFAGEATIKEYSATVHGAYLSGIRAADEIIAG